jgi:hypothetical protein
MALVWFAPLLEHQSHFLNNFEVFFEKINATFGDSNKECTSNIKMQSFCRGSHLVAIYGLKLNS